MICLGFQDAFKEFRVFNFSMYEGIKDLVNGVSLLFIYYDGTDVTGHAYGPDDQKVGFFCNDNIRSVNCEIEYMIGGLFREELGS